MASFKLPILLLLCISSSFCWWDTGHMLGIIKYLNVLILYSFPSCKDDP